jgi:hypothetical protein
MPTNGRIIAVGEKKRYCATAIAGSASTVPSWPVPAIAPAP